MDPELSVPSPARAWLNRVLHKPTVIAGAPLGPLAKHHGRTVLRVADHAERHYYLKVEPSLHWWRNEVAAYRRWSSSVTGLAPVLHAADEQCQAVLLSVVPGERVAGDDLNHHRQAGAWLRRFHTAEPAQPWSTPFRNARRLQRLHHRHPGVLTPEEFEFGHAVVSTLENAPELEAHAVPSHGDFRLTNWLIDTHGVLRVLDFAQAGFQPATRDLAGLSYGLWRRFPGTREAFLEGYGRPLTTAETTAICSRVAARAMREAFRGEELGNATKRARGRNRLRDLMTA